MPWGIGVASFVVSAASTRGAIHSAPLGRALTGNRLTAVPAIDPEIVPIHGPHLAARRQQGSLEHAGVSEVFHGDGRLMARPPRDRDRFSGP